MKPIKTLPFLVLVFILAAGTVGAATKEEGKQAESIGFDGKLVSKGSTLFIDPNDFAALSNMRYYPSGIGTRGGMNNFTSNAAIESDAVTSLIPFDHESQFHLLAETWRGGVTPYIWDVTSGAFPASVLINGDFETGTTYGWTGNQTLVASTDQAHSGTYSVKSQVDTNHAQLHSGFNNVRPNTRYKVNLWFWSDTTSGVTQMAKQIYDQSNLKWIYQDSIPTITRKSAWQHWEQSFITPDGCVGISLLLYAWKSGSAGKCIYYDDITIVEDMLNSEETGASTQTKTTTAHVRDTLVVANDTGINLWGGVTTEPTAFMVEYINGYPTDKYDWVHDGESHTVTAGLTVYVGYSRPFYGFKPAAAQTWKFQHFGGSGGNAAGEDPISGVSETMVAGTMRHWYSFTVKAGGTSTFQLPKINTQPYPLDGSWDGVNWMYPQGAYVLTSGVTPEDYTIMVQDESPETYADLGGVSSAGHLNLGFLYPPKMLYLYFPEEYKNTVTATISFKYWNGSTWVTHTATDGTALNGATFSTSGPISFADIAEKISTLKFYQKGLDLYYIRLQPSAALSSFTRLYKAVAIPDYKSPSDQGYSMCADFNSRLFLANGGDKSAVLISAYNQPDVFIGSDSRDAEFPLIVGKREKMLWMGAVGEKMLFMKVSGNYVLEGVSPATYYVNELGGTRPTVARGSVVVVEREGTPFVVYLAKSGFYVLSAGGETVPISDDISSYFISGDTNEIPGSAIASAEAWYDEVWKEYHCLVNSKELIYSFPFKKWTTFDRGSNVSRGTYFLDGDKERHTILAAESGGTVYEAETGNSDVGTPIISDVTRKPLVLGSGYDGKRELVSFALRYQLISDTSISGATAYLTPSLSAAETTYQVGFSLDDSGWVAPNLRNWRAGTRGFNHTRRYRIPGRIYLEREILWSVDAPWATGN